MRIRGKFFAFAVIAIAAFTATAYFAAASGDTRGYGYIALHGKRFAITNQELNMQEWEQGLMNATVTNSTIALFVFPKPAVYPFWMYDTYYNLDIIWVNATGNAGRVVFVAQNVTGCFNASECAIYTPDALANYVIEAKAGFAARNNVSIGTTVGLG